MVVVGYSVYVGSLVGRAFSFCGSGRCGGGMGQLACIDERQVRMKERLGLRQRRLDRIMEHVVDRMRMGQVEWYGKEPGDEV